MKNNRGAVSSRDTLAISSLLSDPVLAPQIVELVSKGELSIVALDPANTHDITLYKRLYHDESPFEVIAETEHATRNSVVLVIRYRQKTDEVLGKSSLELKTDRK